MVRLRRLEALAPGGAHLWLVDPDEMSDEALVSFEPLLSDEERCKNRALRGAKLQRQDLTTRALVRLVLSRYEDRRPQAWRFGRNAYGRPFVPDSSLGFSISHTEGAVAVLVAREKAVGVDVECVERVRVNWQDIADYAFSSDELAALRRVDPPRKIARFFEVWTLKEAYAKAKGIGLSLPWRQFTVCPDRNPVDIAFHSGLSDDAAGWRLLQIRPTSRHVGAVALHCGRFPGWRVRCRWLEGLEPLL